MKQLTKLASKDHKNPPVPQKIQELQELLQDLQELQDFVTKVMPLIKKSPIPHP